MKLTVEITERPDGDVEVHIKEAASMATTREALYANAITGSLKQHLAKEMPNLVKKVLAQEKN